MPKRLTLWRMIVREIQRSKRNTFLCLLSVVVATGLVVAMMAVSRASVDATRVMMKDMGFNVLITPRGVDPARYQALDFQGGEMPEAYVEKLAGSAVMAQHFVGKYQKTINVEGCTAVLTGVRRETLLKGTEKEPMPTAYDMPRGKVFMGSAIARALGKKTGDPVVLLGKTFAVAKVLPEAGVSPEDIRIFAHLRDVQELLGKPGRINAIDALACRCPENVNSVVAALDKSIREALPDVNVQPYRSILLARHEQRSMMRRLELAALAIVLIGAAVSIWVLTGQNVRQRRYELGVLRALGVAGWRIAALFIGKILIYSAVGAALGPILGLLAAHWFNATDRPILTPWDIFVAILVITPVAAVLAGLPPIADGLAQEPVDLLRNGEV